MAARFSDPGQPFHLLAKRTPAGGRWTGKVELIEKHLRDPLRWRRPRRVFVNSVSDLFHENLDDHAIDRIFGVMWACLYIGKTEASITEGHVFQVLTKRAERMRDYMNSDRQEKWAYAAAAHIRSENADGVWDQVAFYKSPHPRIWLGVSVENQAVADERIPLLLQTPAAVRFLSCEPLLGPVDIEPYMVEPMRCRACGSCRVYYDPNPHGLRVMGSCSMGADMTGEPGAERCRSCGSLDIASLPPVSWVIVGSESGHGARPMAIEWARSIVDQCAATHTPVFVKQIANAKDKKGGNPAHWPAGNWPREFPQAHIETVFP